MKVDIFYDSQNFKLWVVRLVDSEGNQVGNCEYTPTKKLAKIYGNEMLKNYYEAH